VQKPEWEFSESLNEGKDETAAKILKLKKAQEVY
jgi:hypothetical protein